MEGENDESEMVVDDVGACCGGARGPAGGELDHVFQHIPGAEVSEASRRRHDRSHRNRTVRRVLDARGSGQPEIRRPELSDLVAAPGDCRCLRLRMARQEREQAVDSAIGACDGGGGPLDQGAWPWWE